jgi:hypothetical protein
MTSKLTNSKNHLLPQRKIVTFKSLCSILDVLSLRHPNYDVKPVDVYVSLAYNILNSLCSPITHLKGGKTLHGG